MFWGLLDKMAYRGNSLFQIYGNARLKNIYKYTASLKATKRNLQVTEMEKELKVIIENRN